MDTRREAEESSGFVAAVGAIVFNGDRVLAMRRSPTKDAGAGLWETISGRLCPDEQPLDGLRREIREESGLEVQIDPRPIDAYVARRGERPMLIVYYRARAATTDVTMSEEHDRHAWRTPEEFRRESTLTRLADAIDRAVQAGPW